MSGRQTDSLLVDLQMTSVEGNFSLVVSDRSLHVIIDNIYA